MSDEELERIRGSVADPVFTANPTLTGFMVLKAAVNKLLPEVDRLRTRVKELERRLSEASKIRHDPFSGMRIDE